MACFKVKLIGFGGVNEQICAAAARLSTTDGAAADIFDKSNIAGNNASLIRKVLASGHASVLEHAYFNFAFSNVSMLVEQFMIEFRLASFTVKSRRYVNHKSVGYHIPKGTGDACERAYREHIDFLFSQYESLLALGIPMEDARLVMPYAFHSNFFCSVNARELKHMLREMRYGRGKYLAELQEIYDEMVEQLRAVFPYVVDESTRSAPESNRTIHANMPVSSDGMTEVESSVSILSLSPHPENVLAEAQRFLTGGSSEDACAAGSTTRELEFVTASFLLRNVSLPCITHLVRHRMQSVLVPAFHHVRVNQYKIPDSIKRNAQALACYRSAFEKNLTAMRELDLMGFSETIYLCLGGNVLDVMTAMNLRESSLFFNLRCCNRAQWEIRDYANQTLRLLRDRSPEIFFQMGPSCFAAGGCPEGRMTCGSIDEVIRKYARH